jgi:ABC-2 type transport system permease protein
MTDALHAEWTKLRTLTTTWWLLIATVALTLAVSVAMAAATHLTAGGGGQDPTRLSLTGIYLGQAVIVVLAVLAVSEEYSTGMIRATLSAIPKRVPVWLAKIAVFSAVIFTITLVAAFVAFLGGQAALSTYHIHGVFVSGPKSGLGFIQSPTGGMSHSLGVSISHPGSVRAIFGAALYMMGVGLLGLGCGFIIRNTGGAIASLFGLLLVLPLLAQALPSSISDHVSKYLPLLAGTSGMITTPPGTDQLSPWAGLGVFGLYVVAALGIGLYVLRWRDA